MAESVGLMSHPPVVFCVLLGKSFNLPDLGRFNGPVNLMLVLYQYCIVLVQIEPFLC